MKELTGTLVIGGNETTSGTFIRKEEVEDEIDTKNNIIMLHKIIDCKHKDEIDELVNAL
ncbi:MAG: hypothetical protein GOV02_01730, partial [Candidatus Aenigmarchaeota archaeon]|nr:hypothetical protein [Candidatus Aenigmarchaeota archaeon]